MKILFFYFVLVLIFNDLYTKAIYIPNEINQNEKPYKYSAIKTTYKNYAQPFYHSDYSKVYIHHKNYTSSLLGNSNNNDSLELKIYPVYISEEKQTKIDNILKDYNANVVEKDTLNSRTVYKRRIEKQKNIEILSRCPQGATGQFVYELACNQYLDCWNGRGEPRNCAPGTLFNPKTLECDYPNKVQCLTGPTARSLTLPIKYERFQQQAQCPEMFTGLIPNYTDCTKFIQCNNGMETSRDCPTGTLFDINQNICNHPNLATCFSNVADGNEFSKQFTSNSNNNHYKVSVCQPSKQNCPFFEHQLELAAANVIYIQYVICNVQNEDCSNFQQGIYMIGPNGALCNPNEQTCGQPVVAAANHQQQFQNNNYYVNYILCNVSINECVAAYHRPSQFVTLQWQQNPHQSSSNNYNKICNAGDVNCYQSKTKAKPAVKCPDGFQGITKHPYDCKKFLNCANGITYIQDCGPGTLFNPFILTCDFPYNVDCKENRNDEIATTTEINYGYEQPTEYNYVENQRRSDENNCNGYQCNQPYSISNYNNAKYPDQQFISGQRTTPLYPYNCIGNQCVGYQSSGKISDGQYNCHGVQCDGSRNNRDDQRQYETSTFPQTIHRTESNSVNSKSTPINRQNGTKYRSEQSVDYVDIFNPEESRYYFYPSTTPRINSFPKSAVWPPPFPNEISTDINADYIFEYEDGEPVTLSPENVLLNDNNKKIKSKCNENDFVCNKKSCIAKNFVCDGIKDCIDGKDEKYCQNYLEEFKSYKDSRLHSLEKQKWNNVTHATCALLCMENDKFMCRSFNFRRNDQTCFLMDGNIGISGALKISHDSWDYYERRSTTLDCTNMHKCPNGKCLISDLVCDGFDDCGDRADEKNCRASDFGYQVKLAGSQQPHEGRVEITVFGKTGYICDDQFNLIDADVVCKEIGFELGAIKVIGNSHYAKDIIENNTLYMMDDIECLGNETSLMHCNFPGWGIHNCDDHEIAGVICKTKEETCSPDFWKCDTGNECVRLPFVCDGVFDCTDNSDEANHYCDLPNAFRLVNGSSENQGRLEVRHNGIWGSICDDDFNEDAVKIICRDLGFAPSGYVIKDGYFGSSSGPIWLDQVTCFGNETSLEKCTHWEWGEHNCDHAEDVGIICNVQNSDSQRSPKTLEESLMNIGIDNKLDKIKSSELPPPAQCGYRKDNIFLDSNMNDVHFRVVQGSVATAGEYPWQAALRIKSQSKTAHWCGAVVIASKWILTAAHCLDGYPKSAYVVAAGEYDIDTDEGTEQQAFIEEYYLHENFRQGHKMGNDIALIKLKGSGFKLNQDIQPICLPDEDIDYNADLNCTISGFGTVETGKMVYSHKLRAAWIPIHKIDVCKMAHIYGDNIGVGMFCAGDLTGGVDACDGDSGGPLACLHNGVFTLYGLTSWGQRCGYANKPGVYVKVAHYKRWIENIMNIHG